MASSSFLFFIMTFAIGLVLLLVIVSWVIKAMLVREMNQKFEEFRVNLKVETQKTINDVNALIQRQNAQGVPERTEKVVHLYAYLMDLIKAGKGFGALRSMEELRPRTRKLADYGMDFMEFYQKNGLFLSDPFCQYIDRHIEPLESLCAVFSADAPTDVTGAQEAGQLAEYATHWKRFEDFVPGLVIELKKEYNRAGSAEIKTPSW